MSLNLKNPALIVIDVQKGFDDKAYFGERNNPNAEENIAKLLKFWRQQHLPIIHYKNDSTEMHSPLRAGLPGNEIKDIVKPLKEEIVLTKMVNSAFVDPKLLLHLCTKKVTTLVLVGLTTDHCVSTTARHAANLGFAVYVVDDATATFDRASAYFGIATGETMHRIALLSLEGEFATIVKTEDLINAS